jgi:hypothetical protein
MRTFGHALAVGAVLLVAPCASAHYTTQFDLALCTANATDIVVVDPDGRVLECWRGELKVGETVALGPAHLTVANALPWDQRWLRPDRALDVLHAPYRRDILAHRDHTLDTLTIAYRGYIETGYSPPRVALFVPSEMACTAPRFVLFLRKECGDGLGAVWMPAVAPPAMRLVPRHCWGGPDPDTWDSYFKLSVSGNIDFTTSVAWVESDRVLALQAPVPSTAFSDGLCGQRTGAGQVAPIALNLTTFKEDVLSQPRPLAARHATEWQGERRNSPR